MSRIGKKPILIPAGVEVKIEGQSIVVKGNKGELARSLHECMKIEKVENTLTVLPKIDNNENNRYHGLTRTLVSNMVQGVSEGFAKSLTLIGVGYRAAMKDDGQLQLTLGYSHPVIYDVPKGVQITVDKQTTVLVNGADKELVGQVAANIRSFRKPEPYHGKGVRYSDERIVTKVGKTGSKK